MIIDRSLNLVLEVERDDNKKLHFFSTPISDAVFETYFEEIGETFTQMFQKGGAYALAAGPRVAALTLKKVATASGTWEGPRGVGLGLMGEIRRLTTVLVPRDAGGWETVPIEQAQTAKLISKSEADAAENMCVFFTCASRMLRPKDMADLASEMTMWGARTSSSNITELIASLTTSTAADSTGETVQLSSIPH